VGELSQNQGLFDEPAWQEAARELLTLVDSTGNAESFGISR
jgi:hypothetical protein